MTLFLVLILIAFLAFSARWNWWRLPRPGIPILMYHKVGIPPEGSKLKKLWVSPTQFRRQMTYLKENGYAPLIFRDLVAHWDQGVPLPPKPIVITFDDGYKNNFELASPILNEVGFRATVFVVVNTIEGDNTWHDPASEVRIPMMSWRQVLQLQQAGWEIGSHTLRHRRLASLAPAELTEEVQQSRQILQQKVGQAVDTFAYPYGNGEDEPAVREAVLNAGYRLAVGVHAGKWTVDKIKADPFRLPRIFVRGDENIFDFALQLTRGRSCL